MARVEPVEENLIALDISGTISYVPLVEVISFTDSDENRNCLVNPISSSAR